MTLRQSMESSINYDFRLLEHFFLDTNLFFKTSFHSSVEKNCQQNILCLMTMFSLFLSKLVQFFFLHKSCFMRYCLALYSVVLCYLQSLSKPMQCCAWVQLRAVGSNILHFGKCSTSWWEAQFKSITRFCAHLKHTEYSFHPSQLHATSPFLDYSQHLYFIIVHSA